MANIYSQRTYDNALLLKAAALVAATADGTLVLDVGNGVLNCDLVVDVSAIEVDTTDESYTIILEGSPDATFGTAGNIVVLAQMVLGHASSVAKVLNSSGVTDTTGRYLTPVRNELNGTTYRYLRIRTKIVGTIATGINYLAFLAKRQD
jgi:hypothetical protein